MSDQSQFVLTASEVYSQELLKDFQMAPGGEWLSFVSRDNLYLISSMGGHPRPLTNSNDISNAGVWSPDGRRILVSRTDKLSIIELTQNASEGPAIVGVRDVREGKLYDSRASLGDAYLSYPQWRPPDGDYILFATQEGAKTTLRAFSTDGDGQRQLFSTDGAILGWDWSPDGRKILFVTRDENGREGNISILDFDSGEREVQWRPKEEHYQYQRPVAAWTPSGNQIVFRSNHSGWSKLWIASTDGSDARPLTSGNWDDYAFRYSLEGDHIVYASGQDQNLSGEDLWIIPISGGVPRRLTRYPGTNVPLAWSGDRIFYWHSSAIEPGDLWTISLNDVATEAARLTFSAPAQLKQKLRAPDEVTIYNEDGTEIPTLIYLPADYKDQQQYPAIIWVRGGPAGRCRQEFKPFHNWLANLGYVVITPNYRGSVGYGVPHMLAVLGDGVGKNDLSDIFATAKYVKDGLQGLVPNINLERGIGIGGQSWGGYLTLMAITQSPTEFSCAVAGAAISDWLIQQARTEVRSYDYWLMGGWVYEQDERARTRSPTNFIEQIRVPLFIYHGELDRDVPFSQSEAFFRKAQAAGVSIDKKFYPEEEHNLKKLENQEHNLHSVGDFFRRHLQPWNFRDNPCSDQVT